VWVRKTKQVMAEICVRRANESGPTGAQRDVGRVQQEYESTTKILVFAYFRKTFEHDHTNGIGINVIAVLYSPVAS
jgi:hypothetical protein